MVQLLKYNKWPYLQSIADANAISIADTSSSEQETVISTTKL